MGLNAIWDEAPVDVTAEANFIWSIANKLRGSYMPDKYGDVIIPMVIIRRFECTLEKTKQAVVDMFEKMPTYPYKAICKISGFQFYNTSQFDLRELCNDADNIAKNFNAYVAGFSDILDALNAAKSEEKYMSPEAFLPVINKVLSDVDSKLVDKITDALSVMDKNAEIQREKKGKNKGEIIYDKDTKDTEIVKYDEDIEDYMAREVLPHIPDAKWFFENLAVAFS